MNSRHCVLTCIRFNNNVVQNKLFAAKKSLSYSLGLGVYNSFDGKLVLFDVHSSQLINERFQSLQTVKCSGKNIIQILVNH